MCMCVCESLQDQHPQHIVARLHPALMICILQLSEVVNLVQSLLAVIHSSATPTCGCTIQK